MSVLEIDKVKILRAFSNQADMIIDHKKLDLILLAKKERICYILNLACPLDPGIEKKEKYNIKKLY